MSSLLMFILSAIAVVIVVFVWVFWHYTLAEIKFYFLSQTGKGILKGIVLALAVAAALGALSLLTGCQGTYFNYASVYGGLESTKNLSPACDDSGADSRITSNLGLRGNVYLSPDKRYAANAKYTHHSCAFSPDDKSYDALGVELEYMIWSK